MQHNQRPHLPPTLNLEHEQEQFDFDLASTYRARLNIDPSVVPLPPNADTLRLLTERHLRHVPFENLSLHGAGRGRRPHVAKDEDEDEDYEDCEDESDDEPAIPLSISTLANKILYRKRGGCCFELNGLLGHFLSSSVIGYDVVRLVPCWVYAGPERGHTRSRKAKFRTRQSHAFLLVRTRTSAAAAADAAGSEEDEDGSVDRARGGEEDVKGKGGESYILDVGLGEPPLHPLHYGLDWLGVEQRTPEGMASRIVREEKDWTDGSGKVRRCCRLEWWVPCRRCWQRSHELSSSSGCNIDADTANTNVNSVEAQRLALLNTAKELRVAADKARRKSKAKPRSAYKVYASDPTVRDQATLHLFNKLRREEQKKQTKTGNGHGTTQDAANKESSSPAAAATTSSSVAFKSCEVRREICAMWANLDDNGRAAYSDMALEEMESLREEAHRAEVKAAIAEGDAKQAKEEEVNATINSGSGTYACCNDPTSRCGGNGGYWEPRLQWDVSDAPLIPPLEEGGSEPSFIDDAALSTFTVAANIICEEGSTFVRKAVACVLTREAKVTLSGNVLKVTSPRFPNGSDWPVQTCIELESLQDVREVLQDRFGIPLQETEGLNLLGNGNSEPTVGSAKLWENL